MGLNVDGDTQTFRWDSDVAADFGDKTGASVAPATGMDEPDEIATGEEEKKPEGSDGFTGERGTGLAMNKAPGREETTIEDIISTCVGNESLIMILPAYLDKCTSKYWPSSGYKWLQWKHARFAKNMK